jgi:hypothetical protein
MTAAQRLQGMTWPGNRGAVPMKIHCPRNLPPLVSKTLTVICFSRYPQVTEGSQAIRPSRVWMAATESEAPKTGGYPLSRSCVRTVVNRFS